MFKILFTVLTISVLSGAQNCKPSITTASGPYAPLRICSGKLILNENFNTLDKQLWQPEVTLGGGGNNEFQWYTADDENSFSTNGKLQIKPTFTANEIGYDQVENGYVNLNDCTDTDNPENCERQAGGDVIINPIRSARLNTLNSFNFKYGRVEIIAKTPRGDWLWPALWLLAAEDKYNGWSGEIDMMESRGNRNYVKQFESTVHFGQLFNSNHKSESFEETNDRGFDADFHKYELIWDDSGIEFLLDGDNVGSVPVQGGYWNQGSFEGKNEWSSGTGMAPFDQEFYLLINLAVGGIGGFFPDDDGNNKPWSDSSPDTAMKDFWNNREQWTTSWSNLDRASFFVDSVKVWAI